MKAHKGNIWVDSGDKDKDKDPTPFPFGVRKKVAFL